MTVIELKMWFSACVHANVERKLSGCVLKAWDLTTILRKEASVVESLS